MNVHEKIGRAITKVGLHLIVILIMSILGLLVAFPIKWTWNFTTPYLFDWPMITWSKAWCLFFLSNSLLQGWPKVKQPEAKL